MAEITITATLPRVLEQGGVGLMRLMFEGPFNCAIQWYLYNGQGLKLLSEAVGGIKVMDPPTPGQMREPIAETLAISPKAFGEAVLGLYARVEIEPGKWKIYEGSIPLLVNKTSGGDATTVVFNDTVGDINLKMGEVDAGGASEQPPAELVLKSAGEYSTADPPTSVTLLDGDERIHFIGAGRTGPVILGRVREAADLVTWAYPYDEANFQRSCQVSGRHAELRFSRTGPTVTCLKATNGTLVDGETLTPGEARKLPGEVGETMAITLGGAVTLRLTAMARPEAHELPEAIELWKQGARRAAWDRWKWSERTGIGSYRIDRDDHPDEVAYWVIDAVREQHRGYGFSVLWRGGTFGVLPDSAGIEPALIEPETPLKRGRRIGTFVAFDQGLEPDES